MSDNEFFYDFLQNDEEELDLLEFVQVTKNEEYLGKYQLL